jgi:hypothetical protein
MRLGHTLDASMTSDEKYRADMALASALMLSVMRGQAHAPRTLRWRCQTGGAGDRHIYTPTLARIQERDRLAETQRTQRDCCPRCGARGDYACGHARIASGRLVAL